MFKLKDYKMGFDPWGLGLFLAVLLPNMIWAAFPPAADPLSAPSLTPVLDLFQTLFQVLMAGSLCMFVNTARPRLHSAPAILTGLYYIGWIFYFAGFFNPAVVLALCVFPALAFVLFAWERKNAPAFAAAALFLVCHVWRSVVNFMPFFLS